jgi:hypothetical protein
VTGDLAVLLAVGGLALLCLVLAVALVQVRRSAARTARQTVAALAELRRRLDELERAPAAADGPARARPSVEFLITDLGREEPGPEPVTLGAPAFADVVLKETVVKAASLVHGVRRGLAPASRHRIRFEMKQEVRRARKQRRADLRTAQRDLRARERAALAEEAP